MAAVLRSPVALALSVAAIAVGGTLVVSHMVADASTGSPPAEPVVTTPSVPAAADPEAWPPTTGAWAATGKRSLGVSVSVVDQLGCGGSRAIDMAQESITVEDERGVTIATGALPRWGDRGKRYECIFVDHVEVPPAKFYKITVGNYGSESYSFDQLKSDSWNAAIYAG